jgi:hypothetical protein
VVTDHPILDLLQRDYPGLLVLLVAVLIVLDNLPEPGRKWDRKTVYEWAWKSVKEFVALVRRILPAALGGKDRPERS